MLKYNYCYYQWIFKLIEIQEKVKKPSKACFFLFLLTVIYFHFWQENVPAKFGYKKGEFNSLYANKCKDVFFSLVFMIGGLRNLLSTVYPKSIQIWLLRSSKNYYMITSHFISWENVEFIMKKKHNKRTTPSIGETKLIKLYAALWCLMLHFLVRIQLTRWFNHE